MNLGLSRIMPYSKTRSILNVTLANWPSYLGGQNLQYVLVLVNYHCFARFQKSKLESMPIRVY